MFWGAAKILGRVLFVAWKGKADSSSLNRVLSYWLSLNQDIK